MATYAEEESGPDEVDNFKPIFKKYKRRDRPLDVSDVIDFDKEKNLHKVEEFKLEEPDHLLTGLKPVCKWKGYCLKSNPGFLFIVNPFENGHQRYWVSRCLKDYPCQPNVRNLDAYMDVGDVNIWNSSVEKHKDDITNKECLMMKLRWVTMGYHYHWGTKKYYKDSKAPFQEDMSRLGRYVASAIGYPKFSPEAAVLNYYHLDSSLSGHTDHSEFDHSAPLISFSFGQDAIFLIGGETKETEPSAVFLRSGDICVMSASARLVYHAVPRIMETNEERNHTCFDISDVSMLDSESCHSDSGVSTADRQIVERLFSDDWDLMSKYLSQTRINFNIRQVLVPDREFPAES
ncbi:nucleic acid dioxygenase ALKBH1-like [Pecten maximus]|uniref:nucleic acid dioxygenase ALKBH1-like n=1 Tax=Pecten maximus TaxID=6579 RepID=UPI001458A021|nr:nucleic acid dioxygenase ALKBH1-like [Pecten maximus]